MRLAQLDRAFGYGPKGREFESSNAQYKALLAIGVLFVASLLNLGKKDHYLLVETDILKEDMEKEGSDAALELQLLFLKK